MFFLFHFSRTNRSESGANPASPDLLLPLGWRSWRTAPFRRIFPERKKCVRPRHARSCGNGSVNILFVSDFFIRVFYSIKRDVIETIFSFNWCKQRFNTLYNTLYNIRNFWSSSLHLALVQFLNVAWWYVKEKFDIINLTY